MSLSLSVDKCLEILRLRPATLDDVPHLEVWDREPHVISCSSDRPDLEVAFDGIDWSDELTNDANGISTFIAEAACDEGWRPIGVLQVCDPQTEPSHYWGEIEPGLRAIDIWIGPRDALNRGYGTRMMAAAINAAFAEPDVDAIVIDPLNSNTAAHRFYHRLGFRDVGRQIFNDEDDCLVMRLDRADWYVPEPSSLSRHPALLDEPCDLFLRKAAVHKKVVRVAGVEPALLSELDFESSASTNFTTPAFLPPILADAHRTYTAPSAKTELRQPSFPQSQSPGNAPLSTRRDSPWIGRQTTF